jgi:twitching motility protein PilT
MADKRLNNLLEKMVLLGGSDLHVKTNSLPKARIHGDIQVLDNTELKDDFFEYILNLLLNQKQRLVLEDEKEFDGYYVSEQGRRFRFNIFFHLEGYGLVFRIIPERILSIKELGLLESVYKFVNLERGLVLVTGTTGSGKSTTLAAIIDAINQKKRKHIITIEDPIEFVHHDCNCIVEQRNVGEHTQSFYRALKASLREDPDIILVGELRDMATIETALHAANSGHLVFATLHTLDAKETIDRIISTYPTSEQNRIRVTLASVLKGVLSQRLIKKISGGRCAAIELLVTSERIKQLILEKRDNEITDAMSEGEAYGMQTFDQALFKLYKEKFATFEEVLSASTSPDDLKLIISNSGLMQDRKEVIRIKNFENETPNKQKEQSQIKEKLKIKRQR